MEQISLIQFFVVVMLGGTCALIPISRLNSQSEVVEVAKPGVVHEFCQWQTFRAQCSSDETIVMRVAEYGRMASGRCVKRDYGYVGCYADVLSLADARCSGKQECEISIPDKVFDKANPCPEDLRRYLRASYDCVKVVSPSAKSCKHSEYVKPKVASGFLSSLVTDRTKCGSASTPWLLTAKTGQKINLTLWDFSLGAHVHNGTITYPVASKHHCHVYAIIKERESTRSITVCGGQHRHGPVYISTSNVVEVRLINAKRVHRQYLLQFEPVGCPDVIPPVEGWAEREGNEMTMGCNAEPDHAWKLTCQGGEWVGPKGNCTIENDEPSLLRLGTLPHGSSVLIVVAVALLVGLVVLILGLLCLKRSYSSRQSPIKITVGVPSDPSTTPTSSCSTEKKFKLPPQSSSPPYEAALLVPESVAPPCELLTPLTAVTAGRAQCARHGEDSEYAYVEEFQFPTVHGNPETQRTLIRRMQDPRFVYGFSTGSGSLARNLRVRSCYAPGKPQPAHLSQYLCAGPGVGAAAHPQLMHVPMAVRGEVAVATHHITPGRDDSSSPSTMTTPPMTSTSSSSSSPVPQYFILDAEALQEGTTPVSHECRVEGRRGGSHSPAAPETVDPDMLVCDRHAAEHAHRCDIRSEEDEEVGAQ